MGFFDKLFGKARTSSHSSVPKAPSVPTSDAAQKIAEAGQSLNKERMSRMFERPPSFSLLIFVGDVLAAIPDLFSACEYKILSENKIRGSLSPLYSLLDSKSQERNKSPDVVFKGACVTNGFTILADPEMIISSGSEDKVSDFCKKYKTMALSITWERVSETVMAIEQDGSGILRFSHYTQGKPDKLFNPHEEINPDEGHRGLLAAARKFGLDLGTLGDLSMTVYQLQG